jgi:hypothetical protein
MHWLDVAFLALVAAWPLARAFGLHRHKQFAMGFALLVVLGLPVYLALDLMRWPMVPALALLVWWETEAVNFSVGATPPTARRLRDRLVPLGMAVVLVLPAAWVPSALLPRVPAFHPSGTFLIGVDDRTWPDSAALAAGVPGPVVPVRIWFPAEPAPRPSRARRHRDMDLFEQDLAGLLPGPGQRWVVRSLTRAPLPLALDMRLSTRQREFPVVLLSHGYPGSPALHATLATELASHGYVVASPEHAAGALGLRLPDESHLPATAGAFGVAAPAAWPAQVRADMHATLLLLESLNTAGTGGRYAGRLLLDEVALVAEGEGGGVVGDTVLPVALTVSLGDGVITTTLGSGTTRAEVAEARTLDLTDLAWWSPRLLRRAGLGGHVEPREAQRTVHQVVLAALRRWLGAPIRTG